MAACIWFKASGGLLHWNSGIVNIPQSKRHQPILSTLRDMENASADKVDLSTREIFLDDHDNGLMGDFWLLCNEGVVAKTIVPWKDGGKGSITKNHMSNVFHRNGSKTNTHTFCLLSCPQDLIGLQ